MRGGGRHPPWCKSRRVRRIGSALFSTVRWRGKPFLCPCKLRSLSLVPHVAYGRCLCALRVGPACGPRPACGVLRGSSARPPAAARLRVGEIPVVVANRSGWLGRFERRMRDKKYDARSAPFRRFCSASLVINAWFSFRPVGRGDTAARLMHLGRQPRRGVRWWAENHV